ncbi:5'-nucleotidase C-terminal domain-containing protein [Candidatus Laterigemmans baculatus]|uniref:5'-nucleotidase C-terminal domain-containing protein n=1 Tax=Candidatus Laterigemmans baculatus TaxID=2770505 RepID=UPI0013DA8956|nr:5'-nucleotidase C-terminal domain-containing protein [Candidatus Laterigemmans baculatus]
MRYDYDPKLPLGNRVVDIRVEGDAWAAEKEYLIATNAMLAVGGHHQKTFTRGASRSEHESQSEVVKKAFKRRISVSPPEEIRIQKVSAHQEQTLSKPRESQRRP